MNLGSLGRLRSMLLLTATVPLLVAGIVALTPAGADAMVPLLVVGFITSGTLFASVYALSEPLVSLAAVCSRVTQNGEVQESLPVHRGDEIGEVARALAEIEERRRVALESYQQTVEEVVEGLNRLADGTTLSNLTVDLPCEIELEPLTKSFRESARKLGLLRQRLASMARILQQLPAPVIAVDDTGVVRFINTSAEKLLGRPAANCMRQDFRTMLCNPTAQADPLDRPILSPATLLDWIRRGSRDEVVVEFARNEEQPIRIALSGGRLSGGTEGPAYLLLRDLSEEYHRVGKDRSRTREELLRSVWDSTALAGSEPLDAILAASRLLTADAKQSSRRDAMLPRVTAVRQHAGSLEAYVRTVRWLNMALWGEFPRPIPTEFQAIEPVRSILDQLAPRLTSRNITTSISDRGGWMTGDEEWVRTALLGVLNYAAESAQEGTLGIQIRRLPPLVGSTEERVEFTILDAGPALSETQLSDILSPFGDLHTPGYLSEHTLGFLPGLILGVKLTQQMGGQIDFGSTPGGGLSVRLEMPTRVVSGVLEPAPETLEAGPIEELVCGWRLGVA